MTTVWDFCQITCFERQVFTKVNISSEQTFGKQKQNIWQKFCWKTVVSSNAILYSDFELKD